jgi:hypothetical protein
MGQSMAILLSRGDESQVEKTRKAVDEFIRRVLSS